jgi:hypothetical protein
MYYLFTTNEVNVVLRFLENGNQMCIPMDEANTDYQQYLAWVAEGNTAEEWTPESNA